MEKILINKDFEVFVNHFDWQISPLGRQFKQFGLSQKVIREYWKDRKKITESHWYYHFKYDTGEMFSIEIDYNNRFVQLIKNK